MPKKITEPVDLLEDKFREPYQSWLADPSPVTADHLLKTLNPVIDTGLKSFGPSETSPMLKSRAKQIVLNAIPKYDPQRTKLTTFLMQHLQGLQRISYKQNQAIGIPEQVRLDKYWLDEAENELKDTLGRVPSLSELADKTGLSLKRINKVRKAWSGLVEGSLVSADESGEDIWAPATQTANDKYSRAWTEFVYHSLPPRDQVIMEHSLGLFGKQTMSTGELARHLNITPSAVSQRKQKIQTVLSEYKNGGSSWL